MQNGSCIGSKNNRLFMNWAAFAQRNRPSTELLLHLKLNKTETTSLHAAEASRSEKEFSRSTAVVSVMDRSGSRPRLYRLLHSIPFRSPSDGMASQSSWWSACML